MWLPWQPDAMTILSMIILQYAFFPPLEPSFFNIWYPNLFNGVVLFSNEMLVSNNAVLSSNSVCHTIHCTITYIQAMRSCTKPRTELKNTDLFQTFSLLDLSSLQVLSHLSK